MIRARRYESPAIGRSGDHRLDARSGIPLGARPGWLAIRGLSMLLAASIALFLPTLSHRFGIAALLAFGGAVQPLLPRLVGVHRVSAVQAVNDLAILALITVVEPSLWPCAALWIGTIITWQTMTTPLRVSGPLALASIATTLVIGLATDIELWWTVVVTQTMLAGAFAMIGEELRHEVAANEAGLLAAVSAAGAIIQLADLERGSVTEIHGDVQALTGYTDEEWMSMDLRSLVHPDDVGAYWIEADQVDHDIMVDRVGRIRHADGSWIWIRDVTQLTIDRRGRRTMRGFAIDVTELEEGRRRLAEQARLDVVTDLPNRLALIETMDELLTAQRPFALLMIDLDRFKEVNDTLGHEAGDQLLEIVARRLERSVGPADHLSRLGGDEFAIVIGGAVDEFDVQPLLGHISQDCAQPITIRGIRFAVSMSTGVAFASRSSDRATLMRHADIAMYDAKRASVPHRFFDDSLEHTSTMQLSLSAALPDAIRDGDIRLSYQPKFDLVSGELVGAEGLVRWHHPEFGVLTPNLFLDVAFLSESAVDFTTATIEQAITMVRRSIDLGCPIPIAANVAIRSVRDVEFSATLFELLRRHDVPAHLLTLEITENDVQHPSPGVIATFGQLTDAGVGLSIDDFGTGHSSLERLRTLHVNELKIDRSFVAGLCEHDSDRHIVQTIIDLAARLDDRVVAEGVETEEQAQLLATMGCRTAQGYLWAPALPTDEFVTLLQRHAAPAPAGEPSHQR